MSGNFVRRILENPLKSRFRWIPIVLLTLSVALFVGCGKKAEVREAPPPPPPPAKLHIDVTAAADSNLGPGGKPLPVVVRIYELKGQGAFTTADFFALYDKDAEVLGSELIARDEVTLAPGQSLPIERPLKPDATYLGAVAAFRDIDRAHWREPLRLRPGVDNRVEIRVGARAVSIRHE